MIAIARFSVKAFWNSLSLRQALLWTWNIWHYTLAMTEEHC